MWRQLGPKMTICLAAFSHKDRVIVTVSDSMVTVGNNTADNSTLKWRAIHGDWSAEFAGDTGIATRVLERATKLLDPESEHDSVKVGEAMERAWSEERAALIQARAMADFGLTQQELLRNKPSAARKVVAAVAASRCDFLITGFDEEAYPHVLCLTGEDGKVRDCDSFSYWAVGSGAGLALAQLAERNQSMATDPLQTIYNLLEARFVAEADANVGNGYTNAMIKEHRRAAYGLSDTLISALRELVGAHRRSYPTGALDIVRIATETALGRKSTP